MGTGWHNGEKKLQIVALCLNLKTFILTSDATVVRLSGSKPLFPLPSHVMVIFVRVVARTKLGGQAKVPHINRQKQVRMYALLYITFHANGPKYEEIRPRHENLITLQFNDFVSC